MNEHIVIITENKDADIKKLEKILKEANYNISYYKSKELDNRNLINVFKRPPNLFIIEDKLREYFVKMLKKVRIEESELGFLYLKLTKSKNISKESKELDIKGKVKDDVYKDGVKDGVYDKDDFILYEIRKADVLFKTKLSLKVKLLRDELLNKDESLTRDLAYQMVENKDLQVYQKHLEETISQLTIHLTKAHNELQFEEKIINQIHEALIFIDLEGRISSWNLGAKHLFGYTQEEVVNKDVSLLFYEEGEKSIHNKVLSPLLARDSYKLETLLKSKSGRILNGHLSISGVKEDGLLKSIVIYFLDITQTKKLEESLKRTELSLSLLSRLSEDGIISTDGAGKILFWNDKAQSIFGYEKHEILNKTIKKLLVDEEAHPYKHRLSNILSSNESYIIGQNIKTNGKRKDGKTIKLSLSFCCYKIGDTKFFTAIVKRLRGGHGKGLKQESKEQTKKERLRKTMLSKLEEESHNSSIENPFKISEVQFAENDKLIRKNTKLLNYLNTLGMFVVIRYGGVTKDINKSSKSSSSNSKDGKIIFINKCSLAFLGYTKSELKNIKELNPLFMNVVDNIYRQKSFSNLTKIKLRNKQGEEENLYARFTPLYNSKHEIQELLIYLDTKVVETDYYKEHYKNVKDVLFNKTEFSRSLQQSHSNPLFAVNPTKTVEVESLNAAGAKFINAYPNIITGKRLILEKVKKAKKSLKIKQSIYNNMHKKIDFEMFFNPVLKTTGAIGQILILIKKILPNGQTATNDATNDATNNKELSLKSPITPQETNIVETSLIEEKYKQILANIPSKIFITDLGGTIIESNTSCLNKEDKRLNCKTIIGKSIFSLANSKKINHAIKELLTEHKDFTIDEALLEDLPFLQGKSYINISGTILYDTTYNNAFGTMLVYEDVTHTKIIERLTNNSREKYRNIVNKLPYMVLTTNMKEEILFTNQAITKILGFNHAELIGRKFSNLFNTTDNILINSLNKSSMNIIDIKTKTGQKINLKLSCNEYIDPSGYKNIIALLTTLDKSFEN